MLSVTGAFPVVFRVTLLARPLLVILRVRELSAVGMKYGEIDENCHICV
jgi:hypothetical protein